jgi:peptide/nickel transport system substrate-binding protein
MKNPFIPKQVLAKRRSLVERYFQFIQRSPSDSLLWHVVLCVCIGSGFFMLAEASATQSVVIPARGGELNEGIVGSPRFVNPVLALTRADQDMTALIYSGLLKLNEQGELVPDIAESVTVSSGALTYNVVLRQDIRFHDGENLNADDVLFTIALIQDANLKSPLRGNFDDVLVEKIGEYELNFVLQEPYAPFIENLTTGILPKHEWVNLTIDQIPFSQHNSHPIGSGPYEIDTIKRNDSGLIDGYNLTIANTYPERPMIESLRISFFPNEKALAQALIDQKINNAAGLSDTLQQVQDARPDLQTLETVLPRSFSIFFNQNKSTVLRQPEVRAALDMAIDKTILTEEILNQQAVPLTGPIPPSFLPPSTTTATTTLVATTTIDRLETARVLLTDAGWKLNTDSVWVKEIDDVEYALTIDLTTANLPFLADTAEYIASQWRLLGAQVSVRQFEQTDLTQTVIRNRDYETLLFGTSIGRSLDVYPFWHSSQRNDPGLNIGLYANITADAALTTARTSTTTEEFNAALAVFEAEIAADTPAIFLFSPTFSILIPKNINMNLIQKIAYPAERYANIENWHIATESVWPLFTNHSETEN